MESPRLSSSRPRCVSFVSFDRRSLRTDLSFVAQMMNYHLPFTRSRLS